MQKLRTVGLLEETGLVGVEVVAEADGEAASTTTTTIRHRRITQMTPGSLVMALPKAGDRDSGREPRVVLPLAGPLGNLPTEAAGAIRIADGVLVAEAEVVAGTMVARAARGVLQAIATLALDMRVRALGARHGDSVT